ncbi:MAG: cob(I)yrinic acid a,c-diamide adenosyltransferase [Muricomes sp.]
MKHGLIHIYCGDGKGKTTAATGLAVRSSGCGMRVLFARFLKNEASGELRILDAVPEIEVLHLNKSFGFYSTLNQEEKELAHKLYGQLWETVMEKVRTGTYDLLVMDEFMAAYGYGLIHHEAALEFLKSKPQSLEVVLTGRNPSEELIEIADYVSEIQKIKHPFDQNIKARRGIEY